MATFLFTYRVPRKPLSEVLAELDEPARAARMAAWNRWFDSIGASVVERGNPVNDARTVGAGVADTRIGGYSLVTAADFDAAVALAKGCPGVAWGGGVEVGEFIELGDAGYPAAAGDALARGH
jgi:hypothetical protein